VVDQIGDWALVSNGSSMWLRTKSFRLSTAFIDTVWWKSSMACSDSMPRCVGSLGRTREGIVQAGSGSEPSLQDGDSEPNSANSLGWTGRHRRHKESLGWPTSLVRNTWAKVTVVAKSVFANTPRMTENCGRLEVDRP